VDVWRAAEAETGSRGAELSLPEQLRVAWYRPG
jgi:hypothetical protein